MAAPELRLDVRLNLATFRTDLGKAAQAAAAYYYPINLLVNKQNLTKQLTAIGRSLGTTKYNINLNDTSVVLAADKVEKLAASLKKLSGSIQIDFNAGGGAKPLGTAMREMAAKLAKESKGDINRAVEQMTGMRGASPFGTGTRSIPGFKAAAKGMGIENAFKLFFQELDRVDPQGLKKALDDGSVMMMKENREIKQKFDKIQSSAEGLARDLRAMGETAKATGKASVTAGGKTLYPQNYGLKIASLLSQVEKLDKDLRRVSTESGGELLDTLTELSSVLRTTSNSFVGIAGFSKNLDETLRGFDVATKAATRATTAYADRINRRGGGPAEATAGPRLLSGREPGGALVAPLRDDPYRVIQVQVKNAFDIIKDYHKRQLDNFTSGYQKIIEDYHRKILIQLANITEYSPSQKLLGGSPPQLALPPAGGTTAAGRMRVSTGAYLGQPGFMQAPSMPSVSRQPLTGQSTPLASPLGSGYFAVGKGLKDIQSAYGQAKKFLDISRFPVAGAITELGSEFGNAIKQVLLFGTAYKALAFLTSLPGEAFNAAKGLATYRNQLQAVTEATGTFNQSLAFVDNLANRFNVPLASAREGFVKLFASMQPAGFDQGQIENLFTGISKAAATFGLSADKVDRVNYAFAQMASKGQIMSEELKGQLGDVLPGALSLFADAAQMSVPEFSKAMEDGAFKGKAMEQVLDNVAILLNTKFGPSAQGAAKTLQGAVNQIQNNLKLMYESFGPVVDAAAAAFGPQINSLIKDVAETMKVLTGTFTQAGEGFDTLSPRAQAFYAAIQTLRPSLEQAGAALADLGGKLASLLPLFVQVISSAISLASSPLGRGAIIAATAIGILTAALKLLEVTGLKAALKAVYAFIGGLLKIPAATGVARVAIIGLKLALTGVFVGAILMGLDFLIGKLLNIGDAANDSAKDILGMRKELDAMAGAGDIESTSKAYLDANTKLAEARKANQKALSDLRAAKARPEGDTQADINKGVAVANAQTKVDQTYTKVIEAQKEIQVARRSRASAVSVKEQQEEQTQAALQKVDLSAGDGTGKKTKEQSLESYYSLQDQLAKAQTQADIDRIEAAFEHARAMVNAEYDLKEAKANSFQKKAIAFQKEIFAITSEQDAALFKNRNKVLAAAGSVAGGAGTGGGGSLAGMTQYITGDPSHPSYKPDHGTIANYHDHLAFASREAAIEAYNKLIKANIKVTEFQGFGQGVTGPHSGPGSAHHKGLAMDVPGYQWGGSGAIGAREFAGSARVRAVLGMGGATGAAPGKVAPSVKRNELAEQQVALTAREANAAAVEKEAEAIAKLEIATANYVQSLVPTAEQALQNQLLQQRITLTQNSFSPEILEAQLAFAEQELQVAENITKNTEEINRLTAASGNNTKQINALTDANNQLKANLPVSAIQLYTKIINEQVDALVRRNKTVMQDAADQEKVNGLIIGGMTRQAAEAKVTAENLRGNYKKALEEATRQVEIAAAAEEVLAAARRLGKKETAEQTAEYNRLAQALKDAREEKDKLEKKAPEVEGAATGVEASAAPKTASSYIADGVAAAQERLAELTNTGYQVVQAANAIGDAFGTAFKGLVSGSMTAQEALAGMFQSIADHFADMVAQMIAEWIKMMILKGIEAIINPMAGLGNLGGGISSGLSSGFSAGAASAVPTDAAGWGASFGTSLQFANGGIAPGGFTAFANGGMVTGPTMGLVGEGRYNEAIVPLPDGKSIPVQLAGGDGGNQIVSNITVNVNNGQAQSNATGSNSSEMGRKIEGAVKQVIVGELRPGGLLASKK